MKEYIEREAAILALGDEPVVWDDYDMDGRAQSYAWSAHKRGIERAPTIDAVPVVRCRECAHSQEYLDEELFCLCFQDVVPLDGYCHKGDQKEAAHD